MPKIGSSPTSFISDGRSCIHPLNLILGIYEVLIEPQHVKYVQGEGVSHDDGNIQTKAVQISPLQAGVSQMFCIWVSCIAFSDILSNSSQPLLSLSVPLACTTLKSNTVLPHLPLPPQTVY